jgi:excisionase family DNA binding protein
MSSGTQYENLLTPAEVSVIFRCDPKTVTRWAQAGKLTSVRTPGGHRRYKETEVMALLNRPSDPAPDPLNASVRTLWPSGVTGPAAAVRNRLQAAGVATLGDLLGHAAADLADLGLRPPQVDEVRLVLARKGLTLRGEILGKVARPPHIPTA